MTDLSLSDAEVSIVASALQGQWQQLSMLRAIAERRLAEGAFPDLDWEYAASREERHLAALDTIVAKLPAWVGIYMAGMAKV